MNLRRPHRKFEYGYKIKSADEALKEVTEHVKSNPLLIFRIIDALGNWDYQELRHSG